MGRLSVKKRKLLLTLHILFSAIMLGGAAIFLFLSITAVTTNNEELFKSCYIIMNRLASTEVRYSTIATVITGVLLSVLTQWGLLKYYWIIVKEGLTILSIILGPFGMYFLTLKAVTLTSASGINVIHDPVYTINKWQLWFGIFIQIISIVSMYVISVFKPWGSRKLKTARTQ